MESLRLVVADDHDIVRRGLRDLLEAHVGWKVVAEAATGTDAVTKVREFSPDVAILDISMPSLNGLEATRRIIQSGSKTRILILTLHDSDTMIEEMLDAGVRGYVLKSDAARDLFVAVEALQHGKTFFTSKVAEMILNGYLKKRKNSPDAEPGANRITSRHREILVWPPIPRSLAAPVGYAIILGAPTVNSRLIRGICVTNWSLSSLGPECGLVPATNRAAFFCSLSGQPQDVVVGQFRNWPTTQDLSHLDLEDVRPMFNA